MLDKIDKYDAYKLRSSVECRTAIKKAKERDNYTCKRCGVGRYNTLKEPEIHAHHIKSLREYPKLACDIDNLVSLCKHCHYYIEELSKKPIINFWY